VAKATRRKPAREGETPRLYLFGVNRGRIEQVSKELQLGLDIVDNLKDASLLVTSKSHYRRKPQKVKDAESRGLPIYVLRSNTPVQVRQLLDTLYPASLGTGKADRLKLALGEAEEAVNQVKSGQGVIELSPQNAYIRRLQHLIAERASVFSKSLGKDPNRRVTIYK
jgi:hypothetical protein